ncbi:MATE family efflux transporter [Alcanivorax sp. HI0033]|nr:MATE family efflux transporter [Alcanivorax sp. HI0003]KZX72751.1 MATE family efflux transporter [Alcanivorax sp. HI0007]KZX79858.1 MATE family efflux transporter [Alcanivorax sp. HI0011]KZX84587.1 MATE family efflux transporter [Alcanivorax sp. HI0013]KZY05157.1 MATE family efflux transporter [Alcanivorax sp. HI0033]KZY27992.1 MATE family efflux transporter [Alcanivorax sp. HI0035]
MTESSPTTLSLVRQLWQQTWPMALGVMSLLGFYLVDSIFVARLGTAPLAAQSFTFPLAFLVIGVQVGIGIAIAALISRAIGAGQQDQANRLGALVLTGGGLLLGVLLLLLWLLQAPAFSLIGASDAIRELIRPYWAIQVLAMWVGGVLYFGYSLFRAHGNTRFPGLMMVLTSLLNLMLDPILIFGVGDWDGFGLPGAALASLLAFAIGLGILVLALRGKGWVQRHGMLVQMRVSAWPFAQIAGPAMISQLMPPLAAMLATALVARAGDQAVAAWGMASRLESFSIVLVLGMTMALPPWLGRCYGGNDWDTVRRLMRVAAAMVIGWQLLLGLLMALLAAPLAGLLVDTAPVQAYLALLIRWLPPSYGLLGVCMLVVSASNALGWPMRAMLISFLRLFLCYLPLLWLGYQLGDFGGLALGAAFGNLLAGVMAWMFYQQALGKAVNS